MSTLTHDRTAEQVRSACCDVLDRFSHRVGVQEITAMVITERYAICDLVLTGRTRISHLTGLELAYLARRIAHLCTRGGELVPFAIATSDTDTWWMSEDAPAAVAIEINEASGYLRLGWIDIPDWQPRTDGAPVCWQTQAVSAHWGIEGTPMPLSVYDRLTPEQIQRLQTLSATDRIGHLLTCLQGVPVPRKAISTIGTEDSTRRVRDLRTRPELALIAWNNSASRDLCNTVCETLSLPQVGHAEYMVINRGRLDELPGTLRVKALKAFTG